VNHKLANFLRAIWAECLWRRPLAAGLYFGSESSPRGMCGGQCGTGTCLLRKASLYYLPLAPVNIIRPALNRQSYFIQSTVATYT